MVHTEPKYQGAIDEPVPFAGTPEEVKANFATHHFGYDSDDHSDARCGLCDTKVWHQSASYPCGTDVPRQVRVFFTDGTEILMTQPEYAIFAKLVEKI